MRYVFNGVKQKRTVKTACPKCKKKLTRVISKTYYDNGLHDAKQTHVEYGKELDKMAAEMMASGVLCQRCQSPTE